MVMLTGIVDFAARLYEFGHADADDIYFVAWSSHCVDIGRKSSDGIRKVWGTRSVIWITHVKFRRMMNRGKSYWQCQWS